MRRLRSVVAVLLGFLLVSPFCYRLIREPDLGWHLAIGRLIGTSGIPRTNALTWTFPNEAWYATSWLYDWLAATLLTKGGVPALQTLTFLLVGGTVVFTALAARRTNATAGLWMAPVAALSIVPRITERPHVASSLLLVLILWLCAGQPLATTGRRAAGVLLVALFSNLHAGAMFPAAVLGFFCVEAFLQSRRPVELGLAAGAGVALLVNPGGLFNIGYIFEHLSVREVIPIAEMAPPTFGNVPDFYVAGVIALLLALREGRRSPALAAGMLLYGALGFRAVRFAWDFELVVLVVLAQSLRTFRWQAAVPVIAGLALFVLRAPFYSSVQTGTHFDTLALPTRAAHFIEAKQVAGRGYNALRDGGYLEWIMPQARWFQDTRLQAFPDSFFRDEQQAEQSAASLRSWVTGLGAEWAIASRLPERMAGYTQFESPDWALIYWDEVSEVWLRRDVPRYESLIQRFEYRHFRPLAPKNIATSSVADLIAWERELQQFEQNAPSFPVAAILHCGVLRRLGGRDMSVCQDAEELADTPELKTALAEVRTLQQAR
jgi:hypothetical protein